MRSVRTPLNPLVDGTSVRIDAFSIVVNTIRLSIVVNTIDECGVNADDIEALAFA
ncbi:MAG: hypothetical protein ACR5K7_05395 [Symbiopectobacterium sp.]